MTAMTARHASRMVTYMTTTMPSTHLRRTTTITIPSRTHVIPIPWRCTILILILLLLLLLPPIIRPYRLPRLPTLRRPIHPIPRASSLIHIPIRRIGRLQRVPGLTSMDSDDTADDHSEDDDGDDDHLSLDKDAGLGSISVRVVELGIEVILGG